MSLFHIFALLLYITLSDGLKFRSDYTYHSSVDGWLKLHIIPANWTEARFWCHYEGSILASPLTDEMASAILEQVRYSYRPFTGISANYHDGVFFSVEGVPLNRIPHRWMSGQPDNKDGQEQCTAVANNGEHCELFDVRCDQPRPFLCFKKNNKEMPVMNECGTIDHEYSLDPRTGHCYKFHRVGLTWRHAFKACSAEGGYLAVINSEEEAQALRDLIAKYPENTCMARFPQYIAVGFSDWSDKGTQWMTIHGETLKEAGYDTWSGPTEPNSISYIIPNDEHCGMVHRNAKLDDIDCNSQTMPFICEMEPEENNGTNTL